MVDQAKMDKEDMRDRSDAAAKRAAIVEVLRSAVESGQGDALPPALAAELKRSRRQLWRELTVAASAVNARTRPGSLALLLDVLAEELGADFGRLCELLEVDGQMIEGLCSGADLPAPWEVLGARRAARLAMVCGMSFADISSLLRLPHERRGGWSPRAAEPESIAALRPCGVVDDDGLESESDHGPGPVAQFSFMFLSETERLRADALDGGCEEP